MSVLLRLLSCSLTSSDFETMQFSGSSINMTSILGDNGVMLTLWRYSLWFSFLTVFNRVAILLYMEVLLEGLDASIQTKQFLEQHVRQEHVSARTCVGSVFNPIQDGLFWGCSWMGGAFLAPLPKIRHTNPTMMKFGTVIPYLRKIQKMYKPGDTPLGFCWHQNFFYIKKSTYRLDFDT